MVSPAIRRKVIVAAILLAIFAVAMIALQVTAQIFTGTGSGKGNDTIGLPDKSVFDSGDFIYGPQTWRPYQHGSISGRIPGASTS